MSDEEPLDPELAALFRQAATPLPPHGADARVRRRIASSVASADAAVHATAARSLGATIARVGAVFVLGAVAGGAVVALRAPPTKIVYVDRAPSSSLPPSPAPSAVASIVVVEPEPSPAKPSAAPSPSAPRDDLAAERAILDDARSKLAAGNTSAALRDVAEHARRFPHGRLAEERVALEIQALVNAGRYDDARARAAAFRARAPDSVFLPAIDATMKSIP